VGDVLLRAHRDQDSARAFFDLATYRCRATPDEAITDKLSGSFPGCPRQDAWDGVLTPLDRVASVAACGRHHAATANYRLPTHSQARFT
jgi:hypothetical protein